MFLDILFVFLFSRFLTGVSFLRAVVCLADDFPDSVLELAAVAGGEHKRAFPQAAGPAEVYEHALRLRLRVRRLRGRRKCSELDVCWW